MTELGQQSLGGMPPRVRRLVYTQGGSAFWGVDPSTRGVSLAWRGPGVEPRVHTEPVPSRLTGASRLRALYATAAECARIACRYGPYETRGPGIVLVEAPMAPKSRGVNLDLIEAVGAIKAGLWSELLDLCPAFESVVASQWKKGACGRGDIRKPKPTAREEYAVLAWARMNGYRGSSWDEADAWAMAFHAEQAIELVRR